MMDENTRLLAVHRAILSVCQAEFGKGGGGLMLYMKAVQSELRAMRTAAEALGLMERERHA